MTLTHLVVGPPRHGVTQFGLQLHAAMARATESVLWHVEHPGQLDWRAAPSGIHLQFTDRLFGGSPQAAAEVVAEVVGRASAVGCRVTATLHDLPQPSDGHNFTRRTQAYAAVCAQVHGVVVNSEHEHRLLAGYAPERVAVVPLPVVFEPAAKIVTTKTISVGVFGYVYPGKGHHEVLTALGQLDSGAELVAIGKASDGHEDLADELSTRAADLGVRFRLTGYVEDGLVEILRTVTVPVAPHRHVSASGSLNSWLGVGRRPLAPVNRYSEEIMRRNPDALELYPDTEIGLRTALKRALDEPALTWLSEDTRCTPTAADAAAQYARILRQWHR